MFQIKFKNLKKSELTKEAVIERLLPLIDKFPDLKANQLQITLEMQNSPIQAGPDLFKVKIYITKGRYKGVTIEKEQSNLFVALADLIDHMLERLNRYGDKVRVKERNKARKTLVEIQNSKNHKSNQDEVSLNNVYTELDQY